MIRILLADDHPLVRAGIRAELEANVDLSVIAEVGMADEAVQRASAERPDVAVLDVQLGAGSGLRACQQITAAQPPCAVIILTAFDWDVYLAQAWAAGAAAFVIKSAETDVLAAIIRHVHAGRRAFTPEQLDRITTWQCDVAAPLATLTAREMEVLRLLADAATNQEIADELHLAVKTVESHVRAVLTKLHLASRREVMLWTRRTRALLLLE